MLTPLSAGVETPVLTPILGGVSTSVTAVIHRRYTVSVTVCVRQLVCDRLHSLKYPYLIYPPLSLIEVSHAAITLQHYESHSRTHYN